MSRLDPFYIPSPATGINPFAQLSRRLSTMGKIYGPKDLFYSCFELIDDFSATTSDGMSSESDNPIYRKAVSMINHEPLTTEALIAEVEDRVKSKC